MSAEAILGIRIEFVRDALLSQPAVRDSTKRLTNTDTLHLRLEMTVNLNTGDYEGGALQFPHFGPESYRLPRGRAIAFSCSLLHEATDVIRGCHHPVPEFFFNPNDGLIHRANSARESRADLPAIVAWNTERPASRSPRPCPGACVFVGQDPGRYP